MYKQLCAIENRLPSDSIFNLTTGPTLCYLSCRGVNWQWCEVEIKNRKQQRKHKWRDKRKDKTQETKRIKQIVSNVTALLWLSDLFLVTWRRLWKPTRRETFSFCVQTLKWTDVFRAQCKRQLDRTDVSHTCSFNK
jgi:hypothetical protein